MTTAHRVIRPVRGRHIEIDLPLDFPTGGEAEIIVLPLESVRPAEEGGLAQSWLRTVWGSSPDFPDRLPDPPPEAVDTL